MPSSNIRTFVHWKDPTIFAGEDLECLITFKNIAKSAAQRERERTESRHGARLDPSRPLFERQRTATQSTALTKQTFGRAPSIASRTTAQIDRDQRATPSSIAEPNTPPLGANRNGSAGTTPPSRPKGAHGRSLSILSFSGDSQSSPNARGLGRGPPKRMSHNRSTSLQILSRTDSYTGRASEARQPSITIEGPGGSQENGHALGSRKQSGPHTAPSTPDVSHGAFRRNGQTSPGFRFPQVETSVAGGIHEDNGPTFTPTFGAGDRRGSTVASPVSPGDTRALHPNSYNVVNRVLSETSVDGTPRSSSDIHAGSDVSDDTVASELPPSIVSKFLPKPNPSRQSSLRRSRPDEPEHLMMGYAQCLGSFTLDGSLVSQVPFEEVKRKGVMGSQGGGGVVGVEQSKRSSGLFGAFGWNNIGDSLTGLLGKDDMSSMKEMNRMAEMKSIPLLSTPQSILFVDLRLAPGESRSYTYRFKVPHGLPPTYRGRAIKISYHLRLAVQRSGSLESQNVKDVEIPFRVLGGVDRDGEILGHDLMAPYTILQDTARTAGVPDAVTISTALTHIVGTPSKPSPSSGMDDFLRYTERLLVEQAPNAPLMSPTVGLDRRLSSDATALASQKERIDVVILRSNQSSSASGNEPVQSSNKFTISRSGRHVGVLSILRPAYRLGEAVLVHIDFDRPTTTASIGEGEGQGEQQAQHIYLVNVSLETTERVDPSLALRSTASINRVTRKVYALATETTFLSKKASFSLEIPPNATPTFETTGVQLQWRVRVEFTTSVLRARRQSRRDPETQAGDDDDDNDQDDEGEEGGDQQLDNNDGEDNDRASSGSRAQSEKAPPPRLKGAVASVVSAAGASVEDAQEAEWLTADGLLHEVSRDDRGSTLAAKEWLAGETFEVGVPIRVYGVKGGESRGGLSMSEVLEI